MRFGLIVVSCFALVAMPARAHAQAEPAPPEYVPPGHHEKPPPPPSPYKWHVGIDGQLVVLFGARPTTLGPVGWGAGVQLSRALVDVGRMRLGLGASFAYRRVQHSVASMIPFGNTQQFLSHMTFAGLLILDGIFGRVHPWLGVGAGVSVAQYRDPATTPTATAINLQEVVPLIQVGLGIDVEVYRNIEITLAGEIDATFSSTTVGTPAVTPFSPGFFALRHGVGFRF